jgi:RNA polymerase sigma-70 factor (ECF subfamily)
MVDLEVTVSGMPPLFELIPASEALLLEQARQGNADAGHRFVRDYYPGVYRYLLYLTGQPETAEDLTQETFLRAWRYLHQFEGRAPLRAWLHQIAHREFLQLLRRQRPQTSLEEVADLCEPQAAEWTEGIEMREVLRKLPIEEREVMILHYLEGYSSAEIARILRAPASTVRHRLSMARSHLQQELGEGDLIYLNEPGVVMRQWAWLPLDQMSALQARLSGSPRGDAPARRRAPETAGGQRETDVVDSRLTRKVTLAFKATALSDLCEHLSAETGISLTAGRSVADEKVTLFCKGMPLREVMRQLSRPFGYAWVRSQKEGQYRYELMQDLRSQLLEEELRNRDRNTALLVLEREMERYRPYLDLSPDEALTRVKNAPAEERKLLEQCAGLGWGPMQMYFRLSPQEQAALRAGEWLSFSAQPGPGEQPLPPDVARGVLQSLRRLRAGVRAGEGSEWAAAGFRACGTGACHAADGPERARPVRPRGHVRSKGPRAAPGIRAFPAQRSRCRRGQRLHRHSRQPECSFQTPPGPSLPFPGDGPTRACLWAGPLPQPLPCKERGRG